MILTFTANPSIDNSLALAELLERGGVHRLRSADRVAGGKGVNVSRTLHLGGYDTRAILPAGDLDPFVTLLVDTGVPHTRVAIPGSVRINTTVTEPDGTTTKLNGPGAPLGEGAQEELIRQLRHYAPQSSWVVLAGSLPPGVPDDWYRTLLREIRDVAPGTRVACDTSDAAMRSLVDHFPTVAPDLLTPNALELSQLSTMSVAEMDGDLAAGCYTQVLDAARILNTAGVAEVLVTLGSAGALLVTQHGAWRANGAPVAAVSTVGAGDATMAGYLLARVAGGTAPDCLRSAVAYGRAAVTLPGTTMPDRSRIDLAAVTVDGLA